MATLFCQTLSNPLIQFGSLLYAGLTKTFLYLCPMSWYRKAYRKVTWYGKHFVKKHTHLCEVEFNKGVVLDNVTDTAIAFLLDNGSDDIEDQDDSEENND